MFGTEGEATASRSPAANDEPTTAGAFAEDGVDLTVIRWMLNLTPTERLRAVQDLIDAASALRSGGGDDP